ncbi:MAG TPA: ABC transporter permease [Thermomicrobiaceae bacterium]|nr:ABC transporter permease [Thermomicrobiaceae bacterium]
MAERFDVSALHGAGAPVALESVRLGERLRRASHTVWAYPQLWIGVLVLLVLLVGALAAPVIAPYDPTGMSAALLKPPSAAHLFGTDTLGRDTFTRILYGGRLSLLVGSTSVLFGMIVGVGLGLVSGYRLGWVDTVLMRCVDGMMAFPSLVLALTVAFALGPSLSSVIIALAIVRIPGFARLTRGQALALSGREFMAAATAVGVGPWRIVWRHYLPNLVNVILIQASIGAGASIFAEASLGFLGLSVPPPAPSWGAMLRDGYAYLEVNPWQSIVPGAFIFLAVLGFNFLGDGLRDALDPQQRRRRGR